MAKTIFSLLCVATAATLLIDAGYAGVMAFVTAASVLLLRRRE